MAKQVEWRHRKRGRDVSQKIKDGGYPDVKTSDRAQWSMHVKHHAELYLSSTPMSQKEIDREGFRLVRMWKHEHAEVRGRMARNALYDGKITSAEFVERCAKIFLEMSGQLVELGASDGIPLSFFLHEMTALRAAEEAIQPAAEAMSQKNFDLICESDTNAVDAMYWEIAKKHLVNSNG